MRPSEHRALKTLFATLLALVVALALAATPAFAHPAHVFKSFFGSAGSGAGQLSLRLFERPKAGSGVAVNLETGDIYVADTGNHRIVEFSAAGSFIRAWGFGVADGTTKTLQSCTATCHVGIAGSEPGQLSEPTFIVVDNSPGGEGDVYVGDSADSIVTKFDAEGHLLSGWGEGGQLAASPVLATGTGNLTEGSTTITNLNTTTGAFEAGQTLSGGGIEARTTVREVGPIDLQLNGGVTTGGAGVSLSARFPFDQGLDGIAVDPTGDLWVSAGREGRPAGLIEFGPGGAYLESKAPTTGWPSGIAIDAAGDFYVATGSDILKLSPSGAPIGNVDRGLSEGINTVGIAADAASGDLYVDNSAEGAGEPSSGTHVNHFPPSCEPAAGLCTPPDAFGSAEESEGGRLQSGQGLAVGPGHHIYVADASSSHIVAYKPTIQPDVTTGPVANLAQSTATLQGEVNPDGVELSECFFEYGETTEYGEKAPCVETPAQIGTGHEAKAVHADVSGLNPAAYHYRLVARNENNPERGVDRSFGALIDSTSVLSAGFTEATLAARINPNGLDSTCQLQYVEEVAFNASGFASATTVPCEPTDLGAGSSGQDVTATLTGLTSGASYRFRFLANSGAHAVEGPIGLFYAYSDAPFLHCPNETLRDENDSLGLPDCRAYEQVSPDNGSEVYVAAQKGSALETQGLTEAINPMQAATGGNAVTYVGEVLNSGQEGSGNAGRDEGDQIIATRTTAGWIATDITPLGSNSQTHYEAFSDDLSRATLVTAQDEPPLVPSVETTCSVPYSRSTAASAIYAPLFTTESGVCRRPFVVGSSSTESQVVFETAAKKTQDAQVAAGGGHENIYVAAGGQLHLVNVLPGAKPKADPNASVGSFTEEWPPHTLNLPPLNASNVVSSDGTRVFWTDLSTGVVYVRENPSAEPSAIAAGVCIESTAACTVQVSLGAAVYQTATPDGRYAYYTEAGQLWRFDVETAKRQALTPPAAEVQGVIGLNQTGDAGSYLYFVAAAVLTGGEENANEEVAIDGQPNLYLIHDGIRFIATLADTDNQFQVNAIAGAHLGDWRSDLGFRSASSSADGRQLVFMSVRRLSGYSNVDSTGNPVPEIYTYDAESSRTSCVSCDPAGTPPAAQVPESYEGREGNFLSFRPTGITHMPTFISASGSRIVFNSDYSLSPADQNARQDVYEWERAGAGSCLSGSPLNGGGCLYLLSGGLAGHFSALLDASEDGSDVFVVTNASLAPSDHLEKADLYDIRVGGGFPHSGDHFCESGEACASSSPAPPSFQAPGSSSFQAGEPPPCRKGFVRRHSKCTKKPRHPRHRNHRLHRGASHDGGGQR